MITSQTRQSVCSKDGGYWLGQKGHVIDFLAHISSANMPGPGPVQAFAAPPMAEAASLLFANYYAALSYSMATFKIT